MTRHWFQFSLRGFLISLAVVSIWLGWTVERARRRGAAIDDIVKAGGSVNYGEELYLSENLNDEHAGHFWFDLKRVPVVISFGPYDNLDAFVGGCLESAVPIESLQIWNPIDDALAHLNRLNNGCEVTLYAAENVSDDSLTKLRQRLPKINVTTVTAEPQPE